MARTYPYALGIIQFYVDIITAQKFYRFYWNIIVG